MTPRQHVLATLNFKTTGRAPSEGFYLPATEARYPEFSRALFEKWTDNQYVIGECSEKNPVVRGDPTKLGTSVDAWGCVFTNIKEGIMGEVKNPIVVEEDWSDVGNAYIPEDQLSFSIAKANEECAKSDKFMVSLFTPRPFELLQFIRGTENLYMDLMEPSPKFLDFLEKMHDFYCRGLKKWAQPDVQMLRFMDDWGSQRSLLISPELWRKYFRPMYRDYIDIAHAAGKKVFMHSDGYILDILPDLVDLGLDAVNAQIFCMGIENLRQFRGKITFWGEMDRQYLLPHGSVQEIKDAVRKVYDNLWCDGGCVAYCEFGSDAKPENVEAMYETWNELTTH